MAVTIQNIIVEELFGYYNYNLQELSKTQFDMSKLLILYGDNGCGKTTILRLVFNLLSTKNNKRCRVEISNTKFKNVSIVFSDGFIINASRNGDDLIGMYTFQLINKNEPLYKCNIFIETEQRDKLKYCTHSDLDETNVHEYKKILSFLEKRETSIFYLTDKRKLYSMINVDEEEFDNNSYFNKYLIHQYESPRKDSINEHESYTDSQDKLLSKTLATVTKWLKEQNFRGSLRGDNDTNDVYKDIISRIVETGDLLSNEYHPSDKNEFIDLLQNISIESKKYSKLGLMQYFEYKDFADVLLKCNAERQAIVYSVLEPYVNGLLAKIKALGSLYRLISTFTENINFYLNNKEIIFNINEGFKIYQITGEEIVPKYLSSGEKQLLLLFCNTLLAKENASIFIIDEPEISLNIKWQRKLLDSLLDFNKEGQIQFIIASHSFEILAKHKNHVIKLESDGINNYGKNTDR